MRYNALEQRYMDIRVFGKPALFYDMRLDRNTVPKGLYLYEVRYDDDNIGEPVQLAKKILVNYFGTILTREPITLNSDGYLDISEKEDWDYNGGKYTTLEEFMNKESSTEKGV